MALSTQVIQAKSHSVYEVLKCDELEVMPLHASAGWPDRFKACHGFHNLKVTGESSAGDISASDEFRSTCWLQLRGETMIQVNFQLGQNRSFLETETK